MYFFRRNTQSELRFRLVLVGAGCNLTRFQRKITFDGYLF